MSEEKPSTKTISFVVPVFNEESNVKRCYESLVGLMSSLPGYSYEIIFTDNHSADSTFQIVSEIAHLDPHVRVLRFSNNFGFQNSVLTGYLHCSGDAAVQIDCDLQDPVEVIVDFVRYWEKGYRIVYGIRKRRKENFMMNITRKVFYRALNLLSENELPVDSGEFRLIDRVVLDEIKKLDDATPYLRGTISSMGFTQIGVPFDRNLRAYGTSKLSLGDYFAMATSGILNHSLIPLRLATYTGLILGLISLLLVVSLSSTKCSTLLHSNGINLTTFIVLLAASLNALFLGIIGEYLGRIYRQVKRRPNTIIESRINFTE